MRQTPYILFLLMFMSFSAQAADNWELIKKDQGIRVYSKSGISGELIEIKAISHINSALKPFVALMNDVENFKNWMHATQEAKIIQREGPYHYTYYMLSDLPWPARDRDVVLNLRIYKAEANRAVYIQSRNVRGVINEKDGVRRIQSVQTSWRFIPKNNGRIRIVFQTKIKPNVQLPEWLAKKVYHIGPYHTILNMRKMIRDEKYREATVNIKQL